ncbi:MAG: HAMP domain-containing histidine kinase [Myxococcales bacterium]|nr:HAMP domain-containing histidine kinase [Myxococcales bacterium]
MLLGTENLVPPADLNIRIVAPLLAYLRERGGESALAELAKQADVPIDTLRAEDAWLGHPAFERVLTAARARLETDEEFTEACAHGITEKTGPTRFLIGAIGPRDAYELGARNMRVLTRVSRVETRREKNGAVTIRYTSQVPESRLMCLSRQAQMANLPRMWGLPKAHLEEKHCIANGDECCEYRLNLYSHNRWLPPVFGLIAGGGSAALMGSFEISGLGSSALVALAGAGLGYLVELRRTTRLNALASREINEGYLKLTRAEADARREILALTARQHEWIRRLEERDSDDGHAVEHAARGIEAVREQWIGSIRGFSHDLRSPLTVVKTNVGFLRESGAVTDEEGEAVLDDIVAGIQQMEKMLADLMSVATLDMGSVRLEPETVRVSVLAERIRSRINALVHGRQVRASVLPTREAPESIDCDPLLLDRVLDNLLSNAAKYTERGSIVIEVDGTPGYLTIKISDTGKGIDEAELERVFEPGGSRRARRSANSWGVGLSVVVQLLSRIGGRLEVMSKPGTGTTFWAHFPIRARQSIPAPATQASKLAEVVSIRRLRSA